MEPAATHIKGLIQRPYHIEVDLDLGTGVDGLVQDEAELFAGVRLAQYQRVRCSHLLGVLTGIAYCQHVAQVRSISARSDASHRAWT